MRNLAADIASLAADLARLEHRLGALEETVRERKPQEAKRRRLTKRQVAEREGVSPRTIERRVEDDMLPPPQIIAGRHYWWSDQLDEFDRQRVREARRRPATHGARRTAARDHHPDHDQS